MWEGIHEIISSGKNKKSSNVSTIITDNNIITDPNELAENFNNFFTAIDTFKIKSLLLRKLVQIKLVI